MSQTEADGDRGIGTPDQPPVELSGVRPTSGSAAPQRCDTNCTNHAVGCASVRERLAWDRILALHREGQAQADPAKPRSPKPPTLAKASMTHDGTPLVLTAIENY